MKGIKFGENFVMKIKFLEAIIYNNFFNRSERSFDSPRNNN